MGKWNLPVQILPVQPYKFFLFDYNGVVIPFIYNEILMSPVHSSLYNSTYFFLFDNNGNIFSLLIIELVVNKEKIILW